MRVPRKWRGTDDVAKYRDYDREDTHQGYFSIDKRIKRLLIQRCRTAGKG